MSKFYALFSTPQGEVKPALYAVLFVFALLSTWLLTKLVLAFALKKKLFGPVGGRHVGGRQIPRLGGVALIVSFALTAVLAAFLHPGVAKEFLQPQTLAIFAGLLIVGALGVVDDLLQLNWATKFVFQIVGQVPPGRLVDRPRPPSGGQVPPGRLVDPYRPGKKGRAQGPRRRPRAFLPPPTDRGQREETRARTRVTAATGARRRPPGPARPSSFTAFSRAAKTGWLVLISRMRLAFSCSSG